MKGPTLTLLLLAVFWFSPLPIHMDIRAALLGLNTAYSTLLGGVWPALATTLLSIAYFLLVFFDPSLPHGYSLDHMVRIITLTLALPIGIKILLHGKVKAELAATLKAERDAALAHARQLESEVARRVAELRQATLQQHELERFRELDRMKGLFVNAVSHELRTPLTTIVGYVEFLEDGIGGMLSPIQSDYIQQIRHSSRQLQRLVDDLLDFARLEAGTFKLSLRSADLGDKTRQVANSLLPQVMDAKLQLEVSVPEGPVPVTIDAQRIEQVMLNLLSNAVKFTPQDGRLRIRLTTEGDMARWSVEDTGIGIEPGQIEKLFRPYSRIETELGVKGTGLGLSISKAIVEAHGGEIGVESVPRQGSTFWFQLPLPSVETPDSLAELSPQAL
ncbi:MAG TPA: HAMP domain-containing sensor histidine kinase [Stenomitos sp.]